MNQKKRIAYLDLIRSIAIILVVLCHATESPAFYSGTDIVTMPFKIQLLVFLLFTLGRMGVPLFLFLSGFLLLPRKYDSENCLKFWKNKCLPLLVTTEIWIVIYNVFLAWFDGSGVHWTNMLRNMLFLSATGLSHVWYLPMILGLYLCIPFVSIVLGKIDVSVMKIPFLIIYWGFFAIPTINIFLRAFGIQTLSNQLNDYSGTP